MVMNVFSYKHHLALITQKKPKIFQKALFVFLGILLTAAGIVTSVFYYEYKKDEPLRVENQYLDTVIGSFSTTRQSISETLATFQVAGAKIKAIDNVKEATPQAAGFYATLDDIDKTVAKIEALEKNIKFQKSQLSKLDPPPKFAGVSEDLKSFYENSSSILAVSRQEQIFAKQMLVASGLSFYLPVLSDESLWKLGQAKQIQGYYDAKKLEANTALTSLAKLTVPENFKVYYDNQIAYLTLFVETGSKISALLAEQDDKNPETATQVEKAYQLLNAAKKNLEPIAQKLLVERLKVYDQKRSLERSAQINLMASSINERLSQLALVQPQPKTDQVYKAVKSLPERLKLKYFTSFTI